MMQQSFEELVFKEIKKCDYIIRCQRSGSDSERAMGRIGGLEKALEIYKALNAETRPIPIR